MLQERGATIGVYDPQGRKRAQPLLPHVIWCNSVLEDAVAKRCGLFKIPGPPLKNCYPTRLVGHRLERVPEPNLVGQ
jgi:hypothetical protein